ncbi:MAG: TolC family protein [Tannerella sp.]|jgi:outer membrane protein TolC|nr:TolC family protein [Tannerella sp.]
MKRICLTIFFTILCYTGSPAQELFSLKQCIETGLERNYSIRIVRNEEQIAANNATPGNAGYLPTVDLNSGFNGTNYNYDYNYADGTSGKENGVHSEIANVGVNVDWTVFDGFGIQADYAKLKELQRLGELNTRLTIEDFVADIAGEYYNLIRQKIRLSNLRSAVNLSKERLRIVEARYYIGSMSSLDLQQAKVDFNTDSSRLLTQFEVVHTSRIRLSELMAFDPVERKLNVRDSVIYPNAALEEDELWQNTLTNNASLLVSQKNMTLSELDYKKARNRNYPYVKLNTGYGYAANWYDTGVTDRQRRLGFNYGLTVGFTLFDGLNRRREQRNARIRIKNSELLMQELELSLKADHSNLWMAYQSNLERWTLEKESLIAAQKYYLIAIERYKLGELSGIELREAQNSLLEAEERRSIAEYNIKLCEISLMQLSGQILTYLGCGSE